MKKYCRIYHFVAILFFILAIFSARQVIAQEVTPTPTPTSNLTPTPTNDPQKASDLNNKIKELESKVSDLQSQEKSLSSQISVMDNQVKLTQYRIEATKSQIQTLSDDIGSATSKIDNLESSLTNITKTLLARISATYQLGTIQPLQLLLSSQNFTNFIDRTNYMHIVQEHDRKLMYNTLQAKNDYANQKDIFEGKKQKVLSLQTQLVSYTDQLNQEKKEKDALLKITKNDERTYQEQLSAARAEQAAFLQISSGGGNAVAAGAVKKGDIVGYIISGRSACSSGTHLHFEVKRGGSITDPTNLLSNRSIIWDNSPDGPASLTGSWEWPLPDPIRIHQGYGMTYWARTGWYGGGPHTGLDMSSSSSMATRAVEDGQLYYGGIACGGGTLKFSRVDHNDGSQVFYMHVTP